MLVKGPTLPESQSWPRQLPVRRSCVTPRNLDGLNPSREAGAEAVREAAPEASPKPLAPIKPASSLAPLALPQETVHAGTQRILVTSSAKTPVPQLDEETSSSQGGACLSNAQLEQGFCMLK